MRTITGPNGTGRYYVVDEEKNIAYPSVTTILGEMTDKSGIDKWKKRVGEEAALAKSKYAADRGTFMHLLHEKTLELKIQGHTGMLVRDAYLLAVEELKDQISKESLEAGKKLFLNFYRTDFYEEIDKLIFQEVPVWSSVGGGYAGRLDLMVRKKSNSITLIDFKSSAKPKKEEWIGNYKMQLSAYILACKEQYGVMADRAEIWISCETGNVQLFTLRSKDIIDNFKSFYYLVVKYHKKMENMYGKNS